MAAANNIWTDSTLVMLLHEIAFKWSDGCPKIYARLLRDLLSSNSLPPVIIPTSLTELQPLPSATDRLREINSAFGHGSDSSSPCINSIPVTKIRQEPAPSSTVTAKATNTELRQNQHTDSLSDVKINQRTRPSLPFTDMTIKAGIKQELGLITTGSIPKATLSTSDRPARFKRPRTSSSPVTKIESSKALRERIQDQTYIIITSNIKEISNVIEEINVSDLLSLYERMNVESSVQKMKSIVSLLVAAENKDAHMKVNVNIIRVADDF